MAAADPAWRAGWDRLAAEADAMTPEAYLMGLQARLAWFHDGHTTMYVDGRNGPNAMIMAPGFDLTLPIAATPFFDGLYVTAAKREGVPLLGARITHVDGVAIEQVLRSFVAMWPGNNPTRAHHDADLILRPAVLRGARLAAPASVSAPVTVEAEKGGSPVKAVLIPRPDAIEALQNMSRWWIPISPRPDASEGLVPLPRKPFPIEAWRPGSAPNFVHLEGRVLVIAFDSLFGSKEQILAFVREAIAAMGAPGIERVVLDLRRNNGGDNRLGEGLRKHLERSRFNRPGGLYVLIGPHTFSAAQNLTSRIERETWAVFVGEPSGGAPNHEGDARPFQGDGFSAYVSTLPWFDSHPYDKRIWTMPDILAPLWFADWTEGRDRAMEAAFAHVASEPLDDLGEQHTNYSDRPSQRTEWKPFWMS